MEQGEIPQLRIPREDARQRIEAKCELGRTLYGKYMIAHISLDADGFHKVAMIKSDFRLWDAPNIKLLREIFTTPYFADEYSCVNGEAIKNILEADAATEEDERKRVYFPWRHRFSELREALIGKRLTYLIELSERLDLVEEGV
jgi:hypothetical protein